MIMVVDDGNVDCLVDEGVDDGRWSIQKFPFLFFFLLCVIFSLIFF